MPDETPDPSGTQRGGPNELEPPGPELPLPGSVEGGPPAGPGAVPEQPPVGWGQPPAETPPPPVGWGQPPAETPPPPVGWGQPPIVPPATWSAEPPRPIAGEPPPGPPPPVGWAAMAPAPRPEIAPGLVFASTPRRFVAYLIDALIVGFVNVVISLAFAASLGGASTSTIGGTTTLAPSVGDLAANLLASLIGVAITLAYFVWCWRNGARATIGMRLLQLQVGNAFDGRTLSTDQAVRRWVAMGFPLGLLYLLPTVFGLTLLVQFLLYITLLLTTIVSPTKQGLHDRFANSAMVEPSGLGSTGPIVGCIIVVVLIVVVLPILATLLLVAVGTQVSTLLSSVGSPVP